MGLVSKSLYAVSLLQLLHAGFSSYEFHQVMKKHNRVGAQLPQDIKFEGLCAIIIFTLGVFLSFEVLQYYPLRGEEKPLGPKQYLLDIKLNKSSNIDNLVGVDPNGEVSYTPSFVDIKEKREQVQKWLNEIPKKSN